MEPVSKDKGHSDVLLETQQRIKELEREQSKIYNPLDVCTPQQWEDFRLFCVLDSLNYDPWWSRMFHSYESRLKKALSRADILVSVMQTKAEKSGKMQAAKIEWMKEEIQRLEEAQSRLTPKNKKD